MLKITFDVEYGIVTSKSLEEAINNNTIDVECNNILKRSNWVELWESKVDYIESQINELGTKYSRLNIYVNYFCLYLLNGEKNKEG